MPQSLSCPCAVPGECGRPTVIPGRSSNCRPLQRRHHSEPVTEVTGMRISRMKGTETVKNGQSPFLTKGLQSAARTSCPLTADKTHTCSLSCIFCQVHAPTENDQNPFAACGRQTLRGFFDTLKSCTISNHAGPVYLFNTLDADVLRVGSVYISAKSKAISVRKFRHALALTIFIPTPF